MRGLGVADQSTFHVVDTQAVDVTVFDYSFRLVAKSGEILFTAAVGRIHVAVEHQTFPVPLSLP